MNRYRNLLEIKESRASAYAASDAIPTGGVLPSVLDGPRSGSNTRDVGSRCERPPIVETRCRKSSDTSMPQGKGSSVDLRAFRQGTSGNEFIPARVLSPAYVSACVTKGSGADSGSMEPNVGVKVSHPNVIRTRHSGSCSDCGGKGDSSSARGWMCRSRARQACRGSGRSASQEATHWREVRPS